MYVVYNTIKKPSTIVKKKKKKKEPSKILKKKKEPSKCGMTFLSSSMANQMGFKCAL